MSRLPTDRMAGVEPSLAQLLGRLVDRLARVRDGEAAEPLDRWDGDDSFYIEVNLTGLDGLTAEVSIERGRAVITVASRPQGAAGRPGQSGPAPGETVL